ncbi:hypothetical protein AVEN_186391-1 [Araneus ventricosus]|uniref:DDE-1 domain-containing protein n=1 Tax=Araneus ventricosus TaxID=182803 RepID=A0A4Y2D0P2_ARAVE|nr:hypothetical protein AVEN_186391-1 [Araneus ventricosus]
MACPEKTCPTKQRPILFILDGHSSHVRNPDMNDKARENHDFFYKNQLTKSLGKSDPKYTSLSVPGIRDRPGGRGGKTKGFQKKKTRPTKRYDSSSDSSDYCDPPLVDSDDDINLDINDRISQTRAMQLASFVIESSLKTLAEKCGLDVLCSKCGHT